MAYDYELFVIGSGPGGAAAAKRAAKYGARVAIAEQDQVGGTCLNRGCIPKKLMVYASDMAHLAEDAVGYGWSPTNSQFDWQRFKVTRDQYLQQLRKTQVQALVTAGIEWIQERACFLDAHTLEVGEQKITADKVLIAVGGKPIKPDIPGSKHTITSQELLALEQLPQRIGIVGGGYIGVEFASILQGFGTQVTLINDNACILSGFDDEIRACVQTGLCDRGISILCNTTAKGIEPVPQGLQLTLEGDHCDRLLVDQVLLATGRTPNLEGLGLAQAGIETDHRAIQVDFQSRTSQSNIFAVGDCTNRMQLTPVARAEGIAFAETEFGNNPQAVDYSRVPSAVCARPEAASVGQTEAQAREQLGEAVRCYRTEFQPLFYSLTNRREKALMKLVVDANSNRVLGIHMAGKDAAEIISSLAIALQTGATKQDIDQMIGIHPSTSEEVFSLD